MAEDSMTATQDQPTREPQSRDSNAAEAAAASNTQRPGALLQAARKQQGLTLDELVVQTKLPRSTLEAMENDDFSMLSEPVYSRGYYRKYARVLGIDDAPVIAGYQAHAGVVERKPDVPLLVPEDPRSGGSLLPKIAFGLLVLGIIALAYWFFTRPTAEVGGVADLTPPSTQTDAPQTTGSGAPASRAAPAERTVAVRPPQTARTAPAVSQAGSTQAESNQAESTQAGSTQAGSTRAETASTPSTRPAAQPSQRQASSDEPARQQTTRNAREPTPAAAAGNARGLQVRFVEDSWVRITDRRGNRVLDGLIRAGETRDLGTRAPFNVFLGNAPGVRLSYDGEPVSLAQYTRSDNNTARLTVQ